MTVMHDDEDTVRAAMARTNAHLRRWWLLCAIGGGIVLVLAIVSALAS